MSPPADTDARPGGISRAGGLPKKSGCCPVALTPGMFATSEGGVKGASGDGWQERARASGGEVGQAQGLDADHAGDGV